MTRQPWIGRLLPWRKKIDPTFKTLDLELTVGSLPLASIGRFSTRSPMTKAGRLSLRARTTDGRSVKIVEYKSPEHAALVADLSAGNLEMLFPAVLERQGSLLVTEWVEAAAIPVSVTPDRIGQLLAQLHREQFPTTGNARDADSREFSYWDDMIWPRALRAARALDVEDCFLREILPAAELLEAAPESVVHPDLTMGNVIVDAQGNERVIDNELLGRGDTAIFDLMNACWAARPHGAQLYRAYLEAGGSQVPSASTGSLAALWLARAVGSAFVTGRLGTARGLIEDFRLGRLRDPVSDGRGAGRRQF